MPRGDKTSYTDKQKRKAAHIAEGYKQSGVSGEEADARAWATVNKEDGGGNKSGSGRGVGDSHDSAREGGRKGGASNGGKAKGGKTTASRARRAAPARKVSRPQKHGGTPRH